MPLFRSWSFSDSSSHVVDIDSSTPGSSESGSSNVLFHRDPEDLGSDNGRNKRTAQTFSSQWRPSLYFETSVTPHLDDPSISPSTPDIGTDQVENLSLDSAEPTNIAMPSGSSHLGGYVRRLHSPEEMRTIIKADAAVESGFSTEGNDTATKPPSLLVAQNDFPTPDFSEILSRGNSDPSENQALRMAILYHYDPSFQSNSASSSLDQAGSETPQGLPSALSKSSQGERRISFGSFSTPAFSGIGMGTEIISGFDPLTRHHGHRRRRSWTITVTSTQSCLYEPPETVSLSDMTKSLLRRKSSLPEVKKLPRMPSFETGDSTSEVIPSLYMRPDSRVLESYLDDVSYHQCEKTRGRSTQPRLQNVHSRGALARLKSPKANRKGRSLSPERPSGDERSHSGSFSSVSSLTSEALLDMFENDGWQKGGRRDIIIHMDEFDDEEFLEAMDGLRRLKQNERPW